MIGARVRTHSRTARRGLLGLGLLFAATAVCAQGLLPGAGPGAVAADADTDGQPGTTPSPVAEEFASPRDTIATFLLYAGQAVEDSENTRALDQIFRTMEVPDTAGAERDSMAIKLLGFFNALGEIDVDTMAPGPEDVERERLSRFEFFPDNPYPAARMLNRRAIFDLGNTEPPGKIILTRAENGEWKFSGESMAAVGELWS